MSRNIIITTDMKTTDFLARRFAIALLAIMVTVTSWAQQIAGNGTAETPYLINNEDDWFAMMNNVNSSKAGQAYYKLTTDLYLGNDLEPLKSIIGTKNDPFTGHFDGDFHTIHLNMERSENYAAPFGITDGATISNLRIEGVIRTDHKFAGGLIAYSNNKNNRTTLVQNCISSVHIICDNIVTVDNAKPFDCTHGGFVGQNEAGTLRFENCIFDGSITDSKAVKTANKCTGFVGWVNNNVYYVNCTMAGKIDVKANDATLKNSMANFHRLSNTARAYFTNTYFISDYTYPELTIQGIQAPSEAPADVISKKYDGRADFNHFYVPGAIINGFNVTYYGWKLVEGTDYDIIATISEGFHTLTFKGTESFGGSYSESVEYTNKGITKWNDTDKTGWYAIASPVNGEPFSCVSNLISDDRHNIYRYDEEKHMWQEYRNDANKFSAFENGRGYIYRTENELGIIEFNGKLTTGDVSYSISYTEENGKLRGFNLIGNPYNHDIYKGVAFADDELVNGFCTLSSDGTWQLQSDDTRIPPMTAFLVQASGKHTLEMRDTENAPYSKGSNDNIWFTVNDSKYQDVACVEFKEGLGFNKMSHYNEEAPMLYINYDGEDFAMANLSDDVESVNLCFKTTSMSRYTISINANGYFSYLHLIDRLTGDDVDMLRNGSYTFTGKNGDVTDRFIVKFSRQEISNVEDKCFAYQNGSDVIVKGEGQLQVFDAVGRMVMSQMVNGTETVNVPSGLFIFRIVGNETKTQKLIVR